MSTIARADRVPREELLTFVRPRHRGVLVTHRADGAPQTSPVTVGVDQQGRVVVSSYPARAKVANLRARPEASLTVLSDDWDGPWVQLDGQVEVLDRPAALDPLVEYYRSISGEHPDWSAYRAAMERQGKCLLRLTIRRWGPVATGGFPPTTD
jgi:PPOX class probable F420-dependent enzyme